MKLAVSARGDASKLMGSFNAASVVGLERMAGILRHFFFKIDAIAASAASVVAMAGTKVLVSPVSQIMIHKPTTAEFGDTQEMQKAISMLGEIKESIINAYEIKTGLSRAKISRLMDEESWMNAKKAVELGFADDILYTDNNSECEVSDGLIFGRALIAKAIINKISKKESKTTLESLKKRLSLLNH